MYEFSTPFCIGSNYFLAFCCSFWRPLLDKTKKKCLTLLMVPSTYKQLTSQCLFDL